jgi:hypothetical protein
LRRSRRLHDAGEDFDNFYHDHLIWLDSETEAMLEEVGAALVVAQAYTRVSRGPNPETANRLVLRWTRPSNQSRRPCVRCAPIPDHAFRRRSTAGGRGRRFQSIVTGRRYVNNPRPDAGDQHLRVPLEHPNPLYREARSLRREPRRHPSTALRLG